MFMVGVALRIVVIMLVLVRYGPFRVRAVIGVSPGED
jgi:hypothetical protein